MYVAKKAGRNRYRFFDSSSNESAQAGTSRKDELTVALEQDQFQIFFQPQFDMKFGQLSGAEALVSWKHPTRGLLNPGEFIFDAEAAGLMPTVGREVIRQSLDHAQAWPVLQGRHPLRLAINSSAFELVDLTYADFSLGELKRTEFDPTRLEIEISENTAVSDIDSIEATLNRLRWVGVEFAIDGFGIGFSNLSRLKKFELEVLKIDQSLMHGVGCDRNAEVIVSAVFNMYKAIGLRVVAEGIENNEQLEFLRNAGYGTAQGYCLGRPIEARSLLEFAALEQVPNLPNGPHRLIG